MVSTFVRKNDSRMSQVMCRRVIYSHVLMRISVTIIVGNSTVDYKDSVNKIKT